MQLFNRRQASLAILTTLAACGKGNPVKTAPPPVFKRYDGPAVTQVAVYKNKRRMHLLSGDMILKSYDLGLGNAPVGQKKFEGDGKTPEGLYYINRFNPRSRYHLSIGISYPNERDRAYAAQFGRSAGGDIMFHGRGPGGNVVAPNKWDWTAGCIALTDTEIEDVYAMLRIGVPVWIHA
jgi:murein L,D-transpeptidase YafK